MSVFSFINESVLNTHHNLTWFPPAADDIDCSICLQTASFPTRLPCGHVFCFLCVKVSEPSRESQTGNSILSKGHATTNEFVRKRHFIYYFFVHHWDCHDCIIIIFREPRTRIENVPCAGGTFPCPVWSIPSWCTERRTWARPTRTSSAGSTRAETVSWLGAPLTRCDVNTKLMRSEYNFKVGGNMRNERQTKLRKISVTVCNTLICLLAAFSMPSTWPRWNRLWKMNDTAFAIFAARLIPSSGLRV